MNISISQYIEAINRGSNALSTLKDLIFLRGDDGRLLYSSGGQAVIFKVEYKEEFYSLKCFLNSAESTFDSYELVECVDSAIFPKTKYYKDEITILDNLNNPVIVDVVLIEWLEGDNMLDVIEQYVIDLDTKSLKSLLKSFILLSQELMSLPVAHGDIKPQNIIVTKDKLKFIDLDSVCGRSCSSVTRKQKTIWFQHPMTDELNLTVPEIDNYAISVIISSLLALSINPTLLNEYFNGENIIIDPIRILDRADSMTNILSDILYPYPAYKQIFDMITVRHRTNICFSELIDTISSKVIDCEKYSIIDNNGEELRRICSTFGLYGFINIDDTLAIECSYGDATLFSDGVAGVKLNGNWYIVDSDGLRLSQTAYGYLSEANSGVVAFSINSAYGYLNVKNREDIVNLTNEAYDYAYPFREGYGLVKHLGVFYFLDDRGIVQFNKSGYSYARPFSGGYAIVGHIGDDGDKYYTVIDKTGAFMVENTQYRILSFDTEQMCYEQNDNRIYVKVAKQG